MYRIKIEKERRHYQGKERSMFARIVTLVISAIIFALLIGWLQSYRMVHQLDKCKQFETGTQFKGYHCKSDTIYVAP